MPTPYVTPPYMTTQPHLSNPTDLVTRQEVARMLSVHTETVKRWQRAGRLRAYILSKTAVRYSRADVAALLAGSVVNETVSMATA